MKHEIKQVWIAALLSGKFVQGHTRLRTLRAFGYEYCCLGVLCQLHLELTGLGHWDDDKGYVATDGDNRDASSRFVLPLGVLEWAGLPNDQGNPIAGASSLGALNDGNADTPERAYHRVRSFAEIAALVDEHL